MKTRSRTLILTVLAVTAALLLLMAGVVFTARQLRESGNTEMPAARISAKVGRLLSMPAVEHEYRDIIYIDSEKSFFFIPTASKRLLFSVNIRVQAGIDLTRGYELIPRPGKGGAITVRLPPSEILLVDADEESIYQYFVREKRDRIRLLEFGDEIRRLKDRVRSDAEQRGILVQADENVRKLIGNFLKIQGFDEVTFETLTAGGAD